MKKRPRLRLLIDQLKSVPCFDCKKQFDPVCIKSTLSNPEVKQRITQAQQSPSASLKRRRSWSRTAKTPEYQARMRSAAASVAQIKSQKMKEIWAAKRLRQLVSFDRKTWAGLLWGDQK